MIRWLEHRVENLLSRSVDWLSNERQPAVEPKVRWRETPASEPATATATPKATASEAEAQLPAGWLDSTDSALDQSAAAGTSNAAAPAAPAAPALARTAVNPDAPAATKVLDTAVPDTADVAVNDDVEMADVEMTDVDTADATKMGILEYLNQSPDGSAAMIDLVRHTGKSRSTLRCRLEALAKAGRIERVGAGLKTRYRLLDVPFKSLDVLSSL